MNPLGSLSLSSLPPPSLDAPATDKAASTRGPSGPLSGLSLTILGPTGRIEGPGGDIRIHLESPTIGPEDIPLNEFLQQTESIANTPGPVLVSFAALGQLEEASRALGQAIASGPDALPQEDAVQLSTGLEQQATVVERSIRDLIENSTYPNFSDFLKEMVKIAQDLREKATMAKMAAIEGNYEMMMDAADQMVVAAEKSKESREAQIEADKKEAIGKIIGGSLGFVLAFVPGVGAAISTASSQIVSGITGQIAASSKTDSSTAQYDSDLANVAKQRIEAAAKLLESQVQVAEDLRETAKSLRDMVLKLYQDFIGAQNQVISRANV